MDAMTPTHLTLGDALVWLDAVARQHGQDVPLWLLYRETHTTELALVPVADMQLQLLEGLPPAIFVCALGTTRETTLTRDLDPEVLAEAETITPEETHA